MGRVTDAIAGFLGYVPRDKARSTAAPLAGASLGRSTADWVLSDMTVDQKIRQDLGTLRRRSRDLAENNGYFKRYLNMVRGNVTGPRGIQLDINLRTAGERDRAASQRVVDAWAAWGRLGVPTMDGGFEMVGLQNLLLTTMITDGDLLIRERAVDNGFGYALQIIEGDYLDHQLNKSLGRGRNIRLGVELDVNRRPIAYHLREPTWSDVVYPQVSRSAYQVVPAREIIHLYARGRVSATRGIPWINAALIELRHMGGYRDAAIIAARMGAAKMGFITQKLDDDGPVGPRDSEGNVTDEVAPGELHTLPPGYDFKEFDPGYPTDQFDPFTKAMLRGNAAALNVSYASLSSDLEGVTFSSLRAGVIDERDAWRGLQAWFAAHALQPIYERWLLSALLAGAIVGFRVSDYERILAATSWKPRGWAWIEPLKEEKANEQGIANGTRTRRDIALERGQDWQDTMDQQREEQ